MRKAAFDKAYFERYYEREQTRVHGKKEIARLARGVVGIIGWLGGSIESVLDVGAGAGLWRDWFKRHRPQVRYLSTDVSAYACQRYGHEQRDVSKWRAKERFDLIVCQGVLPYLDDTAADRAISAVYAAAPFRTLPREFYGEPIRVNFDASKACS